MSHFIVNVDQGATFMLDYQGHLCKTKSRIEDVRPEKPLMSDAPRKAPWAPFDAEYLAAGVDPEFCGEEDLEEITRPYDQWVRLGEGGRMRRRTPGCE